jgi:putative flavoprotein involved in K+ transport
LTSHAKGKKLPVRSGTTGIGANPSSRRNTFEVQTINGSFNAKNVVITTHHEIPFTPAMSKKLPSWIDQIHSARYRNSDQLKPE